MFSAKDDVENIEVIVEFVGQVENVPAPEPAADPQGDFRVELMGAADKRGFSGDGDFLDDPGAAVDD